MSQYAQDIQRMLATLQDSGREEEALPSEEEELETVHVYPVEGGGILFTKTQLDQDELSSTMIDRKEPDKNTTQTTQKVATPVKEPSFFPDFMLILCFFLLLDMADSSLTALLTPTATITITPKVQTITMTATIPIIPGGNGVQGRVSPALTLSQSQTIQASGHGHQDARTATGALTFYNGSFSPQTIDAGTIYKGSDGVQVRTDQTVTIAAASPGSPPQFGVATVSAHAVLAGSSGNIYADDINITANSVLVQNSQFSRGQNERDFTYVTKGDLRQVINTLNNQLTQSVQAALNSQLTPDEALVSAKCTKTVISDHQPGDQASQVKVTTSETCSAVLYNKDALQTQANRILNNLAAKKLGTGYRLFGSVRVKVTQTTQSTPALVLSIGGVWVFQINEERIKNLIAGKPRSEAIRLLSDTPGIQRISISGITDNQPLPIDSSHIHLLILVGVS
jgi:flagellar motor protein MotB